MKKYLPKIQEYLFYFFIFLLPWQTRLIIDEGWLNDGYWEYGTVSLYATDIVLLFLLLLFGIDYFTAKDSDGKTKKIFDWTWFMIAGLELFIFVSIFFAANKGLAIIDYGRFVLAIFIFWLASEKLGSWMKILGSLLLSAFLQAGIGIWQFINQISPAQKWLGMAEHNPINAGVSVVEALGSDGNWERWLRAYGSLDHPNVLGGFLGMSVLLLIFIMIHKNQKNKFLDNNIYSAYIILVTVFIGLLMSYSKAAWMAVVFGVAGMLLASIVKKDLFAQKKILEVVLIFGVIFFVFYGQFDNLILARAQGNTRLEKKSNQERVEYLKYSKDIINKNWLVGVGIGNYTNKLAENIPNKESWFYQPVHNVFLLVWAEAGIVGLIFFIAIMQSIFSKLWQRAKIINVYKIFLLLPLLVLMLADHWLWSLHFGVYFYWLILGVVMRGSCLLER